MASSVLWIVFLSCGLRIAQTIMVSPEASQRNHTVIERSASDSIPITNENSQRFRRLIPYMTFYVPPNFPLNEFYNLNPIQQQRIVASLGAKSSPSPPIAPHGYQDPKPIPQKVTRLQPHIAPLPAATNHDRPPNHRQSPPVSFNLKFPSFRPNYQIVAYNTRHQQNAPPSPPQALKLHRENTSNKITLNPIQAAMHQNHHHNHQYHPHQHVQQQTEIDHVLPPLSFKNSNMNTAAYQWYPQPNTAPKQIINPFTNHNKLPGAFTPIIYGDPEQVLKAQGLTSSEELVQPQQKVQQPPINADLSSSTNRPIYYESTTVKPVTESPEELTPQQRYVAYLQQQLQLQNQRLIQQYRQPQNNYLGISSTTAPPPIDDQTVASTPAPVAYTQISTPAKPDPEQLYNKIRGQPPNSVKASQQVSGPLSEIKPNYLEYLRQNPQSFIPVPNLFPLSPEYNTFNPLVYYTTPHPGYTSSINPGYRFPELEPLYDSEPAFKVPVKKPPPQIRQHLTETIQNFSPVLTTYRPTTIQEVPPQYNSHRAPPRTEKRKAQRHRPSPTVVTIESGDTNSIHSSYDAVPNIRPAYSKTPEIDSTKDYLLQNEPPKLTSRPNLVQRPSAIIQSEYESDVVHIPKLRPSPRPSSSVLKLRPQSIDEPRYQSDPRPVSSYHSHPENKPNFVLKQPQSHSYDDLEYHTDNFEPSQRDPEPNLHYAPPTKVTPQPVDEPRYTKPTQELLYHPSNSDSNLPPSHKYSRPDLTIPDVSNAKDTQHSEIRPDVHIQPSLRPDPDYIDEVTKPETIEAIKADSEPQQSHPTPSPPSPAVGHDEKGSDSELSEDDLTQSSLAEILRKLQDTNQLPKTLTPDNIDNSLRTLIKILNNLKQTQTIVPDPPQHHEEEYNVQDIETPEPPKKKIPGPSTGRPGIDYPIFDEIPKTKFNCKEQRYKGFFGDPETNCQVWHYCDLNGGQASFLCPNGTIFSQVALTCDWWFNVKCSTTAQLYVLNERLYKFILPFTPKFPEDYSGPLVDKYLALKFQEMEDKMRRERLKGKLNKDNDTVTNNSSANNGTVSDNSSDETSESEESSEEDALGNSSIDTGILSYSTTDPSPSSTTDITSNSIVPTTQETYSSSPAVSLPLPSTTTTYAAISPSETSSASSTGSGRSNGPGGLNSKTTVESEKVEVIEIRTNGDSGHLNPKLTAYVTQNE